MIPNCIPALIGNEWRYVRQCLDENTVSASGDFNQRFEHSIAHFVGAPYAVALSSGTAALHLSLRLSNVRPGDEVITAALTFVATANAVAHCGAFPVFIDCDRATLGMDAAGLRSFLEEHCDVEDGKVINRVTGRRVAAIVPVHLYGHPVDLAPILAIAAKWQLPVVEDGTEALGATYHNKMVGNLHRVCCLSFNGNKIITTGGGGMILTNDPDLAEQARYLSTQAKNDPVQYIHHAIGFNYRMPGLNAALGLAQAEQLSSFIAKKRDIRHRYASAISGLPGVTMFGEASWASSTYWMALLFTDPVIYPEGTEPLLAHLLAAGIQARPLWQPIPWQPAYAGAMSSPIPGAEHLYRNGLCLPCSCTIQDDEINAVVEGIRDYVRVSV